MSITLVATFFAVTEVINELTESAQRAGNLGMQGLIAALLIILGLVIWYQERKRTAEREAAAKVHETQYATLLKHHESFASKAEEERAGFHTEMKAHARELVGLTERSIMAMNNMSVQTAALREFLERAGMVDRLPRSMSEQSLILPPKP